MGNNLLRVRAAPAYATVADIRHINVDRAALVIRGAVVMLADTEALGHGLMSDFKTLEATAALGNIRKNGVQGRLGHPGMSENAAARQVFSAKNFRLAGDRLLADLHLFEPARRSPAFGNDPIEWALDMAEQHPDQLALSVVVGARPVWVLADGSEVDAGGDGYYAADDRPDSATHDLPIMRVESLWAVDLVNEGALTRGMFSPNEAAYYAEGVFDFLDEWRAQFGIPLSEIPRKADQLVEKYLRSRGYEGKEAMTVKKKKLESGLPADPVVAPITDADFGGVPEAEADTAPVDVLDEAAAEAEATAALLDDDAPEERDEPEAESEAVDTAARIDALEADNAALRHDLEELKALLALQVKNTAVLARKVKQIDGEPVMTTSVKAGRGAGNTQAAPPKALTTQQIGSITGRSAVPAVSFDDDPAGASFAAAVSRAPKAR